MRVTNKASSQKNGQCGFSLVELMIAVVLGLLLIGGAITIFSGGVRSSEFNQSLTNLQANARYVLDVLAYDIRMSGFQGCTSAKDTPMKLSSDEVSFTNYNDVAISGSVITASGWTPSAPSGFTVPSGYGEPLVGTHALLVQYASSPGYVLDTTMTSETDDVSVLVSSGSDKLNDGDLVVVSDCVGADLFTIDDIDDTTSTTSLALTPKKTLSKAYTVPTGTNRTVRLMPFISSIYYVGATNRKNESGDDLYSLFRQSYPYDATNNPPVELVEAVDQLQLEFGVTTPSGGVTYMLANNAAFDPAQITSVRVGVLMSSIESALDADDTKTYRVAGQSISAKSATATAGTPQYPKDSRLRMPYTATVAVRNRTW